MALEVVTQSLEVEKWLNRSRGKGKMMVEFFSALMEFNVCR